MSRETTSNSLSWKLAAHEAIWGLIHASLTIPTSTSLNNAPFVVEWTTVVPGSGGNSGGWQFKELSISVPTQIMMLPSTHDTTHQPLSDPDLFLHELDIPNLDSQVEAALREGVNCFRHELYTACLAMLGKASEGTWIELGLALIKAANTVASGTLKKTEEQLLNPFVAIGKKILEVIKLYERQDLFKPIMDDSGVKIQDLRNVAIWADSVRESRNSIHYGAEPAMENSYEKVAALLIGAVPHFKVLYKVKKAADETATPSLSS